MWQFFLHVFTGRSCPSGLVKAVGSKETPSHRHLVTNVCPPGPCWNCRDIEFLWVWASASPGLPKEHGSKESLDRQWNLYAVVHPHQGTMQPLSEILLSHCHQEDVNLLLTCSFVFSYLSSIGAPKGPLTTISSMNPTEPEKPLSSSYLYFSHL